MPLHSPPAESPHEQLMTGKGVLSRHTQVCRPKVAETAPWGGGLLNKCRPALSFPSSIDHT
jgi:hypothetical protein